MTIPFKTVGFVGGGRITALFLEAFRSRGMDCSGIAVSDTNPEVLAKVGARFRGIATATANADVAAKDLVFLALHPPALKAALPEIAGVVRKDAVVVSLAPVVTLAGLAGLLGGFTRVARVLPNAPSIVHAGFNPVAFGDGLPMDARTDLEALLDVLGAHPVVPEDTLEAYAILAAMGPTYFWFQWQTLRELAVSFGLTPGDIDKALRSMLDGAVRTFFDAGLTTEQVIDLVPVKPLAAAEPQIEQAYRDALPRLFAKLKGA
jgi:pyrroline-5-carboxylate reductase